MTEVIKEDDFKNIVNNIKEDIKNTQYKVIYNTNRELIMLYFRIGEVLYNNSRYGNSFIKNLATELKLSFSNIEGFSERNLRSMKLFYSEYKDDEIWQQTVAKLPWGHNILLIQKIKDIEIRKCYIKYCIENGWSRSVLDHQIESNYHLRIGKSLNNFKGLLPKMNSKQVNNIIKDPYLFDFLTLKSEYKEKDLEIEMINKIKNLILELGKGFSFVGNQFKINVGNEEYYIDLLFYHLDLRCYIVVELKNNKFKPEYIGQLNFYVTAVNKLLKKENDNNTIGLLLCKEKDKISVEWSLEDTTNPIGVSSYKIKNSILEKLPTEEEINKHIGL